MIRKRKHDKGIEVRKITLREWNAFGNNPKQRNTKHHFEEAKHKHLKSLKLKHTEITAGIWPDGKVDLGDSHSRRYGFNVGHFTEDMLKELTGDGLITALLYPINNEEELKELYDQCDSRDCVEQSSDKIYSALRELEYVPKSDRFQKPSGFGSVSQLCCAGEIEETIDWVKLWLPELKIFDDFNIPPGRGVALSSGVIAACMMLILNEDVDNDEVRDFMASVRNDGGKKEGESRDGVQWLVEYVKHTSDKTSGFVGYGNVAQKTLACFHQFIKPLRENGDRARTSTKPEWRPMIEKKYFRKK